MSTPRELRPDEQAHWCPWHEQPVIFVRMDEELGLVFRCEVCGEQSHDDNVDDFCWCEK